MIKSAYFKQSTTSTVSEPIAVLSVVADAGASDSLRCILGRSRWTLLFADGLADAWRYLDNQPVAVVLVDSHVPEGISRAILRIVDGMACPPVVVMLLDSEPGEEDHALLSPGVLRLFGEDVTAPEIRAMISHAARIWHERLPRADFRPNSDVRIAMGANA